MRYRAAVGVGEEAHSRQRHWCPWSKPVNVETWGHVPGPVVMAHAFAELRYGIVARQHENGFKCGYISGFRSDPLYVHTPKLQSTPTVRAGPRMLGVGVRHPQAARSARG